MHPEGQLARWLAELSQFDMNIIHRPGKLHSNADGMSCMKDDLVACDSYTSGVNVDQLPCGGCRYCHRAHAQWHHSEDKVDYVVPLTLRAINNKLHYIQLLKFN